MTAIEELKHSIKMHLTVMNGPSPQLAVFLVKVIDFLEDKDEARKTQEIERLAYAIIESIGLHMFQAIEASIKNGTIKPAVFHDQLAVLMAKNRKSSDLMLSKLSLLKEVANCYRSLAAITNAKYPILTDCDGNLL